MKSIAQKAAEYANNLCFSKESMQYLSKEDFEMTFKEGAEYALQNQWISVEDELPIEGDLVFTHIKNTKIVRVDMLFKDPVIRNGNYKFNENYGRLIFSHGDNVDYWMPIPKLTK